MRMSLWVHFVPLVLAACATTASGERTRAAPPLEPGVKGGIAWMRNDNHLYYQAVWTERRVAAGWPNGSATGSLDRTPDGKWETGVTVIEVTGSRLTGPQIDVTFTRQEGGFRLTGLWFGANVDLVLDARGARAQQSTYARDGSGAYVSKDLPDRYVFLVGDAARLEDPPWPEIAQAALTAHWGLDSGMGNVR